MFRAKKAAQVGKGCVACGSCASVCPRGAIRIEKGIVARVDWNLCVGCGRCAWECPAAVIDIVEREELA